MQKTVISKTLIENATRYVAIVLMVVLTPLLAMPVATLFDWATLNDWAPPGQLREFFVELFTVIFWIVEWVAFLLLERYVFKKYRLKNVEAEENTEIAQPAETKVEEEAAVSDGTIDGKKRKCRWKFLWKQRPLLPLQNVGILLLITVACIALVTAQIGFNVKPFYDLGTRTTQSAILIKCGEVGRDAIKCVWIVALLKTSLRLAEELVGFLKVEEKYVKWLQWLGVGVLAVLFGVCDVLVFGNTLVWTYILFYAAFTAIYFFTEQAPIKSFLLIFFIYIF